MSYLVLARRFRPQTFASIVGQEHISRALANAILRDKVAHALLFTGPRGVGKTTTARVLSRALNCTGRDIEKARSLPEDQGREFIEPCGECTNCKEIAKGSSLACREIDGASNNSVDSMREVIESLRTLPPEGSCYKIYLIDEVHMLSTSAFNALLKSLEEPPPNTIFIFATTDPQKIPETVISRCQQFDFRKLSNEIVVTNLKRIVSSEGVKVEERVFGLIAKRAQGGMRDAQSALDRLLAFSEKEISLEFAEEVFGTAGSDSLLGIVRSVLESDHQGALSILAELFGKSLDIRGFISDFIAIFRALYLVKLDSNASALELETEVLVELKKISNSCELFDLQRLFQSAQEIGDKAIQSNYPRYALEAGVAKMSLLPSLKPIAALFSTSENSSKPQTARKIVPKESTVEIKVPVAEEKQDSFNPSWIDFVTFAGKLGSPILSQLLKRVTAKRFSEGVLELEGLPFDISSLKDNSMQESLKKALDKYSSGEKWSISFHELKGGMLASTSVHAQEQDRKRMTREQIVREAQDDPLIKSALETFNGSKIIGVSPVEE
jgi:DNA polymerase-3 subunit gamma/tau